MPKAAFSIVPAEGGWSVDHDGEKTGPYNTREAAFEAAIGPASNAIKEGAEVVITISPPQGSALGAPGA